MSWLAKPSLIRCVQRILTSRQLIPAGQCAVRQYSDENNEVEHPDEHMFVPIPAYKHKDNETVDIKKARLLYQSRKRGMLENGILLSTFAGRYLSTLTEKQLDVYDTLINQPTNDWDIYDWIIKRKPAPEEYDTEVLKMIQDHAENKEMEERFVQPPL